MADEQQNPSAGDQPRQHIVVGSTDPPPAQRNPAVPDNEQRVNLRFVEARDHVLNCPEEKSLRDRTGACLTTYSDGTVCDGQVRYGQTECPHGVLLIGTCETCGQNYDRAGWTHREALEAPASQEA